MLTQSTVDGKTNEIPISTELLKIFDVVLKIFDVVGKVVTIDALLTQKNFCQKVLENQADYALPVKENQKQMYNDIRQLFAPLSETDHPKLRSENPNERGERMFRDLLSSCAIQVGLAFFVLVVGGSLLYSWHVQRTTAAEFALSNRAAQTPPEKNEARTVQGTVETNPVEVEPSEIPFETDDVQVSDDTDVSPIDETSEFADIADAFLPDDVLFAEKQVSEEVPVSPFGFGPYPEVPAGFPFEIIWNNPRYQDFTKDLRIELELTKRVLVKLWKQGDRNFDGGAIQDGKVYPYYHNTVYIAWDEQEGADGTTHQFISVIMAPPSLGLTREQRKQIRSGNPPSHIHILDLDSTGIDPYQFLTLN